MRSVFAKVLKERLEGQNLSKLARDLGIPRTLLHEWTQAKRLPSMKNIEHIKALADYLAISLEELLIGRSESKTISSVVFEDSGKKYQVKIARLE